MADETLRMLEGRETLSIDTSIASTAAKFSSGGSQTPLHPPPAEHIGSANSPTTKISFDNASIASITRPRAETRPLSHARSMSLADTARQKRLSLHFPVPVQPASAARSPRPPSWIESPLSATTPLMETQGPVESPTESNFLAVLAAQERRVLELKEELSKAEKELSGLKKRWSQHEMARKKQDVRRVAQLQPLSTLPLPTVDSGNEDEDTDGSSMWLQKEMERRKQMLSSVKSSNRRVFSGSKHVRTLSLLSPDKDYAPSFPQPSNIIGEGNNLDPEASLDSRLTSIQPRQSSRSSDTLLQESFTKSENPATVNTGTSLDLTRLQGDALLNTGRKMAADLKDGFWTFFEDIRQATVGDEPSNETRNHRRSQSVLRSSELGSRQSNPNLRTQRNRGALQRSSTSSTTTSDTSRRQDGRLPAKAPSLHRRTATDIIATSPFDIGGSFWRDHGLDEPNTVPAKVMKRDARNSTERTPKKGSVLGDPDDVAWDMWDTPGSRYAGNATQEPSSVDSASERGSSARSTPRTSTSSTDPNSLSASGRSRDAQRDSIPWPALAKLVTPSHLKRTASNLMNEWERSLSPSPAPSRSTSPAIKKAAEASKQE